jgi:hypothetical protein
LGNIRPESTLKENLEWFADNLTKWLQLRDLSQSHLGPQTELPVSIPQIVSLNRHQFGMLNQNTKCLVPSFMVEFVGMKPTTFVSRGGVKIQNSLDENRSIFHYAKGGIVLHQIVRVAKT